MRITDRLEYPRQGQRESHLSTLKRLGKGTAPAVLTFAAGVAIGVMGFFGDVPWWGDSGDTLFITSPLLFITGTPLGWLSTYLVLTGTFRCAAAAAREPLGDPLVALVVWIVKRTRNARLAKIRERAREELEGAPVADRLVGAEKLGLTGAKFGVVASRRKPDWTPGTILDCGGHFLRVGEPIERMFPTGLRTIYPLAEVVGADVFRRIMRYEFPAIEPQHGPD